MAIDSEAKRWSMLAMANSPVRTHVFNPDTSGLVSIEKITVLLYYGGNAWSGVVIPPTPATIDSMLVPIPQPPVAIGLARPLKISLKADDL